MKQPLEFLPSTSRKPLFFALLFLTLGLFAVFRLLNAPLITPLAPGGIVTFELAGTIKKTAEILGSWDARANLYAAFGLGLDYLFMPSYALAIALGALLAAGRHNGLFKSIGGAVGWGALAAAAFDMLENFALWRILLGALAHPWPGLAAFCAYAKFGLILVGMLYALAGWVWPKKL